MRTAFWLLDDLVENKFAKNDIENFTRKLVYKHGQSEEIKYLEKWPSLFLRLSCLALLQFDKKIMIGSLISKAIAPDYHP